MHRSLPVVAALVATTALSACGGASDSRSASSTTSDGTVLDRAAAQTAMTDYDRRNNAAVTAASRPPFSEKLWAAADLGPRWESRIYRTRVVRAEGKGEDPWAGRATVRAVLAHRRLGTDSLALLAGDWAETASPATGTPTATPRSAAGKTPSSTPASTGSATPDRPRDTVWYLRRPGTAGAWRMWSAFEVDRGTLPAPVTNAAQAELTPTQAAAARRLPDQLTAALRQETSPFTKAKPVVEGLAGLWPGGKGPTTHVTRSIRCQPYAPRGSRNTTDALVASRLTGATLSVVSLRCHVDYVADDGWTVTWTEAAAKVNGVPYTKDSNQIAYDVAVTGLVSQPDAGAPQLLDLGVAPVLPQ